MGSPFVVRRIVALGVLLFALPAAATGAKHLGPRVSDTLNGLVASKAIARIIPRNWSIEGLETTGDQIRLTFKEAKAGDHIVELRMNDSIPGRSFAFTVIGRESPGNSQILLNVAKRVDSAMTPDVFVVEEDKPSADPAPTIAQPPVPPPSQPIAPQTAAPTLSPWAAERFTMPRAGAFLVASLEILIVLLALLAALLTTGRTTRRSELGWGLALFLASAWSLFRTMGTSPTVWSDTAVENLFIHDCLVDNRCTMLGPMATVGIPHSAGYLHMRSLLEWFGVNANGTHALFILMSALGVTLAATAARRLDGPVAAALAALVMVGLLGVPMQLNVISDAVPMPFLGSLFLLVATTTFLRPTFAMTALMGLVAGVAAHVYVTGVLLGVAGIFIATQLPEQRWKHATIAGAAFALCAFALSPAAWIFDVHTLLTRATRSGPAGTSRSFLDSPAAQWAALAALTWLVAGFRRSPLRRRLEVPVLIILPLLVPFLICMATKWLDGQDKYCGPILGAIAAGAAISLVSWGRRFRGRLPPGAAQRWAPLLAVLLIAVGVISPRRSMPSGFGLPEISFGQTRNPGALPELTFDDVRAANHLLAEKGWRWTDAALNLKTVNEISRREALRWSPNWSVTERPDLLERAYLLKLPALTKATPLPSDAAIVHSTAHDQTVVARTCSWIDWRAFQVCPNGAASCLPGALQTGQDPHLDFVLSGQNMPRPGSTESTLTLVFPLNPSAACPEEWIYMPRLSELCQGRIAQVDGVAAQIEESGRLVRLKSDAANTAPKSVSIEWKLGSPECSRQYEGQPPFFVEGAPATVAWLREELDQVAKAR